MGEERGLKPAVGTRIARLQGEQIDRAVRHIRSADPVMSDVIDAVGPFGLRFERDRFAMLVRSIVSQQISTGAARSIRAKLYSITGGPPTPDKIAAATDAELTSAGLSPQKIRYLRDLADKVRNGQLRLGKIGRLSDEAAVAELTQVLGIGRWTAQMFLIFSLGRPDVLPHDDLGIRNAMVRLYGLAASPSKVTMERIAGPWRPYATVACWYCWRSLDLDRQKKADGTRFPV